MTVIKRPKYHSTVTILFRETKYSIFISWFIEQTFLLKNNLTVSLWINLFWKTCKNDPIMSGNAHTN